MDIKKPLLDAVVNSIDLKKLASAIFDNVVEEALKEVVANSETQFDDMAMAALWPHFEKAAKALIEKKLDLKIILG
jgi:hypothetical protein